jgi:hypothetical protein
MKNIIKFIISAIVLLIIASCGPKDYMLYNDSAKLQFGPRESGIYKPKVQLHDTVKSYTFYYEPASVTQDTLFFDIYVVGGPTNEDRAFKLQQVEVPNETNAIAGTHYKSFTDPTVSSAYVIKAGDVHAFVPIVMLRDATLKTLAKVVLEFKIVKNSNFEEGEVDKLWRRAEFTDMLSKPNAWRSYYFEKYSNVKHKFMIEQTGEKWDDNFLRNIDYAKFSFWKIKFKTLLINYNKVHPNDPLTDEDGEVVMF